MWCQYIGPAIFLAVYNAAFTTTLRHELHKNVSSANTEAIIALGATKFRGFVDQQDLSTVLVAYSNSLDRVFQIVAATGVVAWCAAWGSGWKDIRVKKNTATSQDTESEQGVEDTDHVPEKESPIRSP